MLFDDFFPYRDESFRIGFCLPRGISEDERYQLDKMVNMDDEVVFADSLEDLDDLDTPSNVYMEEVNSIIYRYTNYEQM